MSKNLESADRLVKLILAFSIVLCYFFGIIKGPVGVALVVMSGTLILFFLIQITIGWITMD